MNWREYQNQAADLFRSIGCDAQVEKTIDGARGRHKIDVWVTRKIYGLVHHWVVECKHWNNRVKKESIVVLKGIVDDVGADRGILLSSSGFQSGAISMAERSNITLSSLEEMAASIRDELERYTLSSLEEKVAKVSDGLHGLYLRETTKKDGWFFGTSRPKPGVDEKNVSEAGGRLCILEFGFRQIRIGKNSFPMQSEKNGNPFKITNDLGKFLKSASKIIKEAEMVLDGERAKAVKGA